MSAGTTVPSWRYGQFVLGPRPVERLHEWKQFAIGQSYHLAAHPGLNVTRAQSDEMVMTLLGFIVDPDNPSASDDEILAALVRSPDARLSPNRMTERFGGRWLLIIEEPDGIRAFSDPAALRQMFHTGPNIAGQLWAASEPGILAEILGLEIDPDARDYMNSPDCTSNPEQWWPVDTSPFKEVRRLLPNHQLHFATGRASRFWPDTPLAPRQPEEASIQVAETLQNLLGAMHARAELVVAITAGRDSRMMLAATRPFAKDIEFMTSKQRGMSDSNPDLVIPRRLMASLGLRHRVVDSDCELREDFNEIYRGSNFLFHEKWVYGAQAIFDEFRQEKIVVVGSTAEIAREGFDVSPDDLDPSRPESLARGCWLGSHEFTVRAFKQWADGLGDHFNYELVDLLYWEIRMGGWLASSQLEFSLAWKEIFAPFNCRRLLLAALAVDRDLRGEHYYPFFLSIIRQLWPECLDQPLNPKPPEPLIRITRRRVKKLLRLLLKGR